MEYKRIDKPMKHKSTDRIGAYLMLLLAAAQIVLVLVSWLITAAMPDSFPHSMLSAEGIRWFFGRFTENLASPWLVWLLLVSIAWGALQACGILRYDRTVYRQRIALRLVWIELAVFFLIIILLTMVPHAILLNVMGGLLESSFSRSILPYGCFVVIILSLSYGVMSNQLESVEAMGEALSQGIRTTAPWFVVYILAVQFYSSVVYVMG